MKLKIKRIFEILLNNELNKLPYTKGVDDGQFNDGVLNGFEAGARWAFKNFNSVNGEEINEIEVKSN